MTSERWHFENRYRIAVERDPARKLFRYRWSAEKSFYTKWDWLGSGYALSARGAWRKAHRKVFWHGTPWGRMERQEGIVVRKYSTAAIPDRPKGFPEPVALTLLDETPSRGQST